MNGKRPFWMRIVFASSIVGFVVFVIMGMSRRDEPEYQGKELGVWLDQYCFNTAKDSESKARRTQAEYAIRQIGSNAIPHLLELICETDSAPIVRLKEVLRKLGIHFRRAAVSNRRGDEGFRILGQEAQNAVPALIALLQQNRPGASHENAARALGNIGAVASPAVSALLSVLQSTNDLDRISAITALGQIHTNSDRVVPVLVKCLNDQNPGVRLRSIGALAEFGPAAKEAVPELRKHLEGQGRVSLRIALEVRQALERIER